MKFTLKLNTIIILASFFLVALSLGISVKTAFSILEIKDFTRQLSEADKFELIANQAKYHVVQIQQFLTDAALTHEEDSIKDAKENLEGLYKDMDSLKKIKPTFSDEAEAVRDATTKLTAVGLEMTAMYWQKGKEAGDAIMKRPGTGLDAMSDNLGKLLEAVEKKAEENQQSATEKLAAVTDSLNHQSLLFSFFSVLATILVFMVLFLRLKPLQEINGRILENSGVLQEVSLQLATNAKTLSASNSNQAASTQQTAASLEEIRAMVLKTSENSEKLRSGAEQSEKLVGDGKDRLHQVQQSLSEIDQETSQLVNDVQSGNQEIQGIVQIINEIGEKTKVINDIVFQTKLLSFNASVEAARAGEHGKGFAVVAEEVGNLASMSGQAATEISTMLEQGTLKIDSIIKSNASRIESSIDRNKQKIAESVETANLCESAFNQIVDQVSDVKRASEEITSAIDEQKKGLDEINKAVTTLETATLENVATAETVKTSSASLESNVGDLNQTISDITKIVSGQVGAR